MVPDFGEPEVIFESVLLWRGLNYQIEDVWGDDIVSPFLELQQKHPFTMQPSLGRAQRNSMDGPSKYSEVYGFDDVRIYYPFSSTSPENSRYIMGYLIA